MSIRVPKSWRLGYQITDQEGIATSGELLPNSQVPLTPSTQRLFFAEQLRGGFFEVIELSGAGNYFDLQITVPTRQEAQLKAAVQTLKTPAVATVTQDVHLIQQRIPNSQTL